MDGLLGIAGIIIDSLPVDHSRKPLRLAPESNSQTKKLETSINHTDWFPKVYQHQ